MKKKLYNVFVLISALLLAIGIVFLCLSIFGNSNKDVYLCVALVTTILSNILNIIRNKKMK